MKMLKVLATAAVAAIVSSGCASKAPEPAEQATGKPAASAPASEPQQTPDPNEVFVKKFAYGPDPVVVKAGQSVKWTNYDEIQHTVTAGAPGSPTGQFDHEFTDQPGGTFSFTFGTAGEYQYFCDRHPTVMKGVVKVT